MRRASVAVALVMLAALAVACGRYGEPRRVERPAAAAKSVPLTDPAVSP